MANKTVVAFDLYGTLLSTDSIATQLAIHFGDTKAQAISALWRRYQLEYTWRLNSMGMDHLPAYTGAAFNSL
jgi:2-haloacid dehalogenase